MKVINKSIFVFALLVVFSCTSNFDEINKRPGAVLGDEASARYFLTNLQFELYGPNRFAYWRGPLIHGDRFAGYFTFGHNGSWWTDELSYSYHGAYTDATYGWLDGYIGNISHFNTSTAGGGDFENPLMNAVGKIMKGLYFSKFTDIFGELPYSEAGSPDSFTPKFDTQLEIYQGVLKELDEAMATIGTATKTGDAINDIASNDLYYAGDLQKWKALANTLKLKMGMRAMGAPGATFASQAVTEALNGPLMETLDQDAVLIKDEEISQWSAAAYGDIWHNFGGLGSKWHLAEPIITTLRSHEDPRLSKYARPAAGGAMMVDKPDDAAKTKAYDLIKQTLDAAGVVYTEVDKMDNGKEVIELTFDEDMYYVGQPVRLNNVGRDYARYEMFSLPAETIINPKNSGPISAELILTSSDAYFLRAWAVIEGIGGAGDANALYQMGITRSMEHWGVDASEIATFLANSPMGSLTGSKEEMLEKVHTQRWLANYTNGFEGWAIVRKTGYPKSLAEGVADGDIFGLGTTNGQYPTRLRYGNSARDKNGTKLQEAIDRQGPDAMTTKLWWDVN